MVISSSPSYFLLFWWKLTIISLTLKKRYFFICTGAIPKFAGNYAKEHSKVIVLWPISNTISNAVISYSPFPRVSLALRCLPWSQLK